MFFLLITKVGFSSSFLPKKLSPLLAWTTSVLNRVEFIRKHSYQIPFEYPKPFQYLNLLFHAQIKSRAFGTNQMAKR